MDQLYTYNRKKDATVKNLFKILFLNLVNELNFTFSTIKHLAFNCSWKSFVVSRHSLEAKLQQLATKDRWLTISDPHKHSATERYVHHSNPDHTQWQPSYLHSPPTVTLTIGSLWLLNQHGKDPTTLNVEKQSPLPKCPNSLKISFHKLQTRG